MSFTSKEYINEVLLDDIKKLVICNDIKNNSEKYLNNKLKLLKKLENKYDIQNIKFETMDELINRIVSQINPKFILIHNKINYNYYQINSNYNKLVERFNFDDNIQNILMNCNAYDVLCFTISCKSDGNKYFSRVVIYDDFINSIYNEHFQDMWPNYFLKDEHIFKNYKYPKNVFYSPFREITYPTKRFPNIIYDKNGLTAILPSNIKKNTINYFNSKYNSMILDDKSYCTEVNSFTPLKDMTVKTFNNYCERANPIIMPIDCELHFKNGFKEYINIISSEDDDLLTQKLRYLQKGNYFNK